MKQLFINGQFKNAALPAIYAQDRGFLLADGIFETLYVENGNIVYFNQHFNRLMQSAQFFAIPVPYSEVELRNFCHQLLEKNQLSLYTAALRITLTRGQSERGLTLPVHPQPTLLITASSYHRQSAFMPKAVITTIKRNEHSELVHHKTLQYLEGVLARKWAIEQGFDEGILLNTQNNLTETCVGNLFLVINNEVVTPKISDGILPGILRQVVMKRCEKLGIPLQEKSLSRQNIESATEAFHTNSLIGVQSLASIDNIHFSSTEIAKKVSCGCRVD